MFTFEAQGEVTLPDGRVFPAKITTIIDTDNGNVTYMGTYYMPDDGSDDTKKVVIQL